MKLAKILLILTLGVLVIPIFSIFVLSFQNNGGDFLRWYKSIFNNEHFLSALQLSIIISFTTAVLNCGISFILSLTWFSKKQMFTMLTLILFAGLLPPDIFAISISKLSQLLRLNNSNLFFLVIGLVFYTLPFGVLLFWSRFYFIDKSIIIAAKDIGLRKFYIITNIILPLSRTNMISCFLLSFLLSFNEYPRTYYLSGADELVSEFLNGKLSSGADESIYAGGSITVVITTIAIIGYSMINWVKQRIRKYSFTDNY